MIWNDTRIKEWASSGGITPYDEALVNPASLDLRLGNMIREPHKVWSHLSVVDMQKKILDNSIEGLPHWDDAFEFGTYWLYPHKFVLCHSLELVQIPPDVASILVLKSSQGRLGLNHSHSGWGDPGFGYADDNGNGGASWTFEIQNIAPWPIQLIAGKALIQMVMMEMSDAPLLDYRMTGHYVYQSGPTIAHDDRGVIGGSGDNR